jgi:dTDP-4-amino-4,6-dideoxygalactose transaminase
MPELSSKRQTFLSFQPPAITEEEIEAVSETLRSGWLTTGPRTAELEARMREYLEAKHVLAVSSCTAALHLSLVALGVGPGDEVITTSITWPATANVIVHCGATPVFADVRDDTLNIDPEHVRALITERTKAIVPVDLYGQPSDLGELAALGLPIVEDAAHAAESRYRGRKVGAIADLTCFSLYATKNIAAGEGGLISTNRDDLAEALDDLRVMRRGHGALYDIAVPGYKANLSDVLSSIALVQLDKVEKHAAIRARHVAI